MLRLFRCRNPVPFRVCTLHLHFEKGSFVDITFRPHRFDEADYAAQYALHMLLRGDEFPMTQQEWRYGVESGRNHPDFPSFWDIVEIEGQFAGTGFYRQYPDEYKPGWYSGEVRLHPEYQRQGIGTAWFQRLVAMLAQRPQEPLRALYGYVRNDNRAAIGFVEKHGFYPALTNMVSRLDVAAFDFYVYEGLFATLGANRNTILSLAELQQCDPDWKEKAWRLFDAIMPDVPATIPYSPLSLEEFECKELSGPAFSPAAYFVARQGEDLVGESVVQLREAGDALDTGLTGVLRSHRRMGLAIALKVRAIGYAHAQGAAYIHTSNDARSLMYPLNQRLGFEPLPSWIQFVREFPESPSI